MSVQSHSMTSSSQGSPFSSTGALMSIDVSTVQPKSIEVTIRVYVPAGSAPDTTGANPIPLSKISVV